MLEFLSSLFFPFFHFNSSSPSSIFPRSFGPRWNLSAVAYVLLADAAAAAACLSRNLNLFMTVYGATILCTVRTRNDTWRIGQNSVYTLASHPSTHINAKLTYYTFRIDGQKKTRT